MFACAQVSLITLTEALFSVSHGSVTVSQNTQLQNYETETITCQIIIHTCAFTAVVFQQALLSVFLNQIPMYVF